MRYKVVEVYCSWSYGEEILVDTDRLDMALDKYMDVLSESREYAVMDGPDLEFRVYPDDFGYFKVASKHRDRDSLKSVIESYVNKLDEIRAIKESYNITDTEYDDFLRFTRHNLLIIGDSGRLEIAKLIKNSIHLYSTRFCYYDENKTVSEIDSNEIDRDMKFKLDLALFPDVKKSEELDFIVDKKNPITRIITSVDVENTKKLKKSFSKLSLMNLQGLNKLVVIQVKDKVCTTLFEI